MFLIIAVKQLTSRMLLPLPPKKKLTKFTLRKRNLHITFTEFFNSFKLGTGQVCKNL